MTGSSSILSQCLLLTYTHTQFFIYTHKHMHMYTHVNTHTKTQTHAYTHILRHSYIYTHSSTHIHTHTSHQHIYKYLIQVLTSLMKIKSLTLFETVGIFVKSCNVIKFINNEMWFITCIKFQKIFSHTKYHF